MSGLDRPGMWAIDRTEMARTRRTVWQSMATWLPRALHAAYFAAAAGSSAFSSPSQGS